MNPLNLTAADADLDQAPGSFSALTVLGLGTVVLAAVSLGLLIGREVRFRYRFRRRTPSDLFSYAGESMANAEYGMGV